MFKKCEGFLCEKDVTEEKWRKCCEFPSPATENADVVGAVAEDGALPDGVESVDDLLRVQGR